MHASTEDSRPFARIVLSSQNLHGLLQRVCFPMSVIGKEIIAAVQVKRGIGPLQATALNVTMIVGAGVFVTPPTMLGLLPGPYALLAWIVAGLLILFDGMIWSELGAALPSSGGSYRYLLISYGKERWGGVMAFLLIRQVM